MKYPFQKKKITRNTLKSDLTKCGSRYHLLWKVVASRPALIHVSDKLNS